MQHPAPAHQELLLATLSSLCTRVRLSLAGARALRQTRAQAPARRPGLRHPRAATVHQERHAGGTDSTRLPVDASRSPSPSARARRRRDGAGTARGDTIMGTAYVATSPCGSRPRPDRRRKLEAARHAPGVERVDRRSLNAGPDPASQAKEVVHVSKTIVSHWTAPRDPAGRCVMPPRPRPGARRPDRRRPREGADRGRGAGPLIRTRTTRQGRQREVFDLRAAVRGGAPALLDHARPRVGDHREHRKSLTQ